MFTVDLTGKRYQIRVFLKCEEAGFMLFLIYLFFG